MWPWPTTAGNNYPAHGKGQEGQAGALTSIRPSLWVRLFVPFLPEGGGREGGKGYCLFRHNEENQLSSSLLSARL